MTLYKNVKTRLGAFGTEIFEILKDHFVCGFRKIVSFAIQIPFISAQSACKPIHVHVSNVLRVIVVMKLCFPLQDLSKSVWKASPKVDVFEGLTFLTGQRIFFRSPKCHARPRIKTGHPYPAISGCVPRHFLPNRKRPACHRIATDTNKDAKDRFWKILNSNSYFMIFMIQPENKFSWLAKPLLRRYIEQKTKHTSVIMVCTGIISGFYHEIHQL